ncbi:MAG TPA: NAD(P)-dependent oxidoreductase, partial [Deltaproteobacteria bacterium]|nr:NAD(P)-dependent oxidoreductase [Deltaproteobacteria bacterium]
ASHDWWVYLLVSGAGGTVFYDSWPSVRYRQHGSNLVGGNVGSKARLRRFVKLLEGRFRSWNAMHCRALQEVEFLLTPENREIFRYEVLKQAKPGAVFVNIARGELSPHNDLLRLLDEGRLGGVALDVYENEAELAVGLRSGSAGGNETVQAYLGLKDRENVILTPHNAFNTTEALQRKASQSAEQVVRFLSEKTFVWSVPA